MYALSIMGLKYISIHTTRKVVTNKWIKFSREHKISIHTTRKVVTIKQKVDLNAFDISIHTTRKVVTIHILVGVCSTGVFQSTPPARW